MNDNGELIACCGLFCGDCYRQKGRIADLARDLRKELRQEKFQSTAEVLSGFSFFAAYKDYPQCYELLGEMVKLRCKRGCRNGGGPPMCKIRECSRKKEIDGCWQCDEIETCKKLDFLQPFHGDAHIRNLRKIKKSGVDDFINGKRFW